MTDLERQAFVELFIAMVRFENHQGWNKSKRRKAMHRFKEIRNASLQAEQSRAAGYADTCL